VILTRRQVIEKVLREQGVKFPRLTAAEVEAAIREFDKDLDKTIDRAGMEISRARSSLATAQRNLEEVARRYLCNKRGPHGKCALPVNHPGDFHLDDEGEKFNNEGWPISEVTPPEKEE
jgi:hypothetical protein